VKIIAALKSQGQNICMQGDYASNKGGKILGLVIQINFSRINVIFNFLLSLRCYSLSGDFAMLNLYFILRWRSSGELLEIRVRLGNTAI